MQGQNYIGANGVHAPPQKKVFSNLYLLSIKIRFFRNLAPSNNMN